MKKVLVGLLIVLGTLPAWSQDAEVRGFLYDKATGEPLMFSNVFLQGTTMGISTNENGFYQINKIPPGEYVLMATSIGYDTIREKISLQRNQIITKNYQLSEATMEMEEVEVYGEKIDRKTNVNVGVTKVTARKIKLMPSIGGEPDLAQYIQTLPGVVFTGDQGGQLYIRGGSPSQNLNLLDGIMIYNPFHSIGLFSVFDTDLIRSVDVYSGGFKADYGGRISAVLDVKTRDGNKKHLSGKISANPFTSKVMLEGPLGKPADNGSTSSFLFSQRVSYLNRTAPVVYPYVSNGALPYSFSDTYAKATFQAPEGSKISFSGFNFTDKANLDSLNNINWQNWGIGTNFLVLPGASSTILNGFLGFSQYQIDISQESSQPRYSYVDNFNLGIDLNYYIGKNEIKYGFGFMSNKTDYQTFDPQGQQFGVPLNNTEIYGFLRYKIVKNRFVIEPSMRLHYYASLGNMRPEPRIGFKYHITEKIRFKASGGIFTQNLISTRSDRDVVNLFAGYLSSPERSDLARFDEDGNLIEPYTRLQTARHLIAGFEFDINDHLQIDVEPYLKDFNHLININRNYTLREDYVVESGLARGVDFQVNYENRRNMLRLNYSLGKVTRTGYTDASQVLKTYPTNFDRRHNINLIGSRKFGSDNSWEFNLRWNVGSGFPFTQTDFFYEDYTFNSGIGVDMTTASGDLGIKYAELNGGRLPYYHRLDVTIKKTIEFKNKSKMEINAGVVNAYNRNNIFYVDRVTGKKVYQLPILPSIGLSWEF